jgi:hypothetical protein
MIIRRKDSPMRSTAAQRRAQHFVEFKRQREQEERRARARVIAEFCGDPQATAAEIQRDDLPALCFAIAIRAQRPLYPQ